MVRNTYFIFFVFCVIFYFIQHVPAEEYSTFSDATLEEGTSRIIGGNSATYGQFPWQVHITMIRPTASNLCGAVVKNATHIITAAHCISAGNTFPARPHEGLRMRVRAGGLRLDTCYATQQDREVKRVWIHPYWTSVGIKNDAALLELVEPLELNENVKPISLPGPYEEILRSDCAISGWGRLVVGGPASYYQQYLPVRTLHWSECAKNISIFREANVCVRARDGGPLGACHGDSGGPLACPRADGSDSVLVGVASYVRLPCGNGAVGDGYVSVSHFLPIYNGATRPFELIFEDRSKDVLGGLLATKGQYPWFAQVVVTAPGLKRQCAGAVINESFVLTAASCYGSGARIARQMLQVSVTAGIVQHHICEKHRQTINGDKIWISEKYIVDGAENNVALLHLASPLILNEFVNVVDLPNTNNINLDNENCTLLGFGEDQRNLTTKLLSNTLLQVDLKSRSVSGVGECRSISKSSLKGSGSYVCGVVESGKADNCHGNMGSPLVCSLTTSCGRKGTALAGILGWRSACDGKKPLLFAGPGVFMDLLNGGGKEYSLANSIIDPPPPPTPIGNFKLPRIGDGAYCLGNPFEGIPNIKTPQPNAVFDRHLGARLVVECKEGTHLNISGCGPPVRTVTIRCDYQSQSKGKWVPPERFCIGPASGNNQQPNAGERNMGGLITIVLLSLLILERRGFY